MSSASYLGSGHRLEFYGEDGTLVLANPTTDYMRGFDAEPTRAGPLPRSPRSRSMIPSDRRPPTDASPPVTRLARRFLDAIEQRQPASPGFAEGYRVQISHRCRAAVA